MRKLLISLLLVIAPLQAGCVFFVFGMTCLSFGCTELNDPTQKCIAERNALQRGYQAEECSIEPEVLETKLAPWQH